jgi:hypothetical protein
LYIGNLVRRELCFYLKEQKTMLSIVFIIVSSQLVYHIFVSYGIDSVVFPQSSKSIVRRNHVLGEVLPLFWGVFRSFSFFLFASLFRGAIARLPSCAIFRPA